MSDNAEVTIILEEGEVMPALDLPPGILGHIQKAGSEAFQSNITDVVNNGSAANALLRFGAIERFNELGTVESKAHSGVMSTPQASPSVQAE